MSAFWLLLLVLILLVRIVLWPLVVHPDNCAPQITTFVVKYGDGTMQQVTPGEILHLSQAAHLSFDVKVPQGCPAPVKYHWYLDGTEQKLFNDHASLSLDQIDFQRQRTIHTIQLVVSSAEVSTASVSIESGQ